jgi:hypothetical protein
MKVRAKRCTARGEAVDPAKAPSHAPTEKKLADGQLADHYVLCPEDRAKGYVEPYRESYVHEKCGVVTRMPAACAATYAVQPEYYGSTFCCGCGAYFPVGENGEFVWDKASGQKVGTRRAACGGEG